MEVSEAKKILKLARHQDRMDYLVLIIFKDLLLQKLQKMTSSVLQGDAMSESWEKTNIALLPK